MERAGKLLPSGAVSQEEYDRRSTYLDVARAAMAEEEAKLRTAQQQAKAAEAAVATIQTRIDDATLKSPVRGRVLYRLAEVGEVLAPGGKALTLVNLEDVYMEIFLPSQQAARLTVGTEARITVDHAPGRAAAGHVSFISPEAQFTPKQVETHSERDKLMFRVKIRVPEELVSAYIERIKTGVRGMGYVKVDPSAVWPDWLENLLAPPVHPVDQAPPGAGEPPAANPPAPVSATDAPAVEPGPPSRDGLSALRRGWAGRRPVLNRQVRPGEAGFAANSPNGRTCQPPCPRRLRLPPPVPRWCPLEMFRTAMERPWPSTAFPWTSPPAGWSASSVPTGWASRP